MIAAQPPALVVPAQPPAAIALAPSLPIVASTRASRVRVTVGTTAIAQDYYVVDALAGNPLATVAAYEAAWKARFGWSAADEAQARRWSDVLARYRGPVGDEAEDEAPRLQPRFVTAPIQADRISFAFLGARDAADAWSRAALVTTPVDLVTLQACIAHFAPRLAAFRAVHAFTEAKAAALASDARRYDIEGFLGRVAAWLGVPDGPPLGLRFTIVPLPAGATSSRARVIENYAVVEVAAGGDAECDQPCEPGGRPRGPGAFDRDQHRGGLHAGPAAREPGAVGALGAFGGRRAARDGARAADAPTPGSLPGPDADRGGGSVGLGAGGRRGRPVPRPAG